jgi:hypothetical protein
MEEPTRMNHPELLPDAAQLPALQLALDSMELTPNENMLLLAAGPRLSESANPMDDLAEAVMAAAPPDAEDEENTQDNPLSALLQTIDQAGPEQRRALVILALQNTWISEGVELPNGGISVSE